MKVLRLLFKFLSPYKGNPKYVSGNALRHALSMNVYTSIGIFTNQSKLIRPDNYNQFFQIRTNSSFLDFIIAKKINRYTLKPYLDLIFFPKYIVFDLMRFQDDIIDRIKEKELIQFGGRRNFGYGVVELVDYLYIDLNDIKMPENATHAILISPMLYIPWFFEKYNCRREVEALWNNGIKKNFNIIPKGQFFRLKNSIDIKRIALKGILRKCFGGNVGYGEYYLVNWDNNHKSG